MTCSGSGAVAVVVVATGVATTTTAAVVSINTPRRHRKTSSITMKEDWRRYGIARRKHLVEKDEKGGGTSFDLHKKCPIQRYFQIADRVVADFRSKFGDPSTDIEETYVMGHRLVAFLGKALPQHPDYTNPAVAELCNQSTHNLEWIKLRMQEIALKIDEEQLNLYITMDFDPDLGDDSSVSSEEDFGKLEKELPWEDFAGWAFRDEAPNGVDTDASSNKSQEANTTASIEEEESKTETTKQAGFYFDTRFAGAAESKPNADKSCEEANEPQAFVIFHEDDNDDNVEEEEEDDDDDDDDDAYHYLFSEEVLGSSILQTIADEDVRYETDSEAVDSWAQDGESGTLSGASSGTALTYDPARIAFREIMNRLPRESDSRPNSPNSPPPPPPPQPPAPTFTPSSSEDESNPAEEGVNNRDHWASFDFASARRQVRLARLRNRTTPTA